MRETRAKEILSALPPEILKERQRIVDRAVREARGSGHCDTFNDMLARVFPEFIVSVDGYNVALDSDAGCCRSAEGQTVWAYYLGEPNPAIVGYNEEGYNAAGYDRDGFNGFGYDSEGFDANDMGRVRSRVSYRTRWTDPDGTQQSVSERRWSTGYGEYSMRDAAGNKRVGRPATPEEQAEEDRVKAEQAERYAGRFNPTTWDPATESVSVGTSE